GDWKSWKLHPGTEALKAKAREAGLANLFLPDAELGQGLTTLEYAPMAERMGKYLFAPEIFNCNAPDTGNMEVLYHFGNDAQKEQWLKPLLAGEIRSVFGMTEPDVASSDATNMAATIIEDGDDVVINGKKWWSTGLGHPNAAFTIFMGLSNPDNDKHSRHSMVIVPLDTPGINIKRMLDAYGDYDAPYGHGEMHFDNVRVSKDNIIMCLGKGFAIAQGRLGPGRIHHCMRLIGAAQEAFELMCKRVNQREVFGAPMSKQGSVREDIAKSYCEIEQARLLTLKAADAMDRAGNKDAKDLIAMIKVIAPNMALNVIDRAIQIHGAVGLSQDTPLVHFFSYARTLRLADGPDQVHMMQLGRNMAKQFA
ncbi:acyl-CoA dehydrogenase family protein, partial [uncultured Alcanivorax sp.]|uniref:acyl-CoA dehydrogenase family protein n=1 Tax=uncultured Alcanivorax sp. TaxID=191215 RepID=UPI002637BCDC